MTEIVVRYVVTHLDRGGSRVLTFAAQARFTYATEEEAGEAIVTYQQGLRRCLLGDRAETLEVRPVPCWSNYDPKTRWFDS